MPDQRQITCQHLGCTCSVAEDFCGDYCRDHAGGGRPDVCQCGHDGCGGPARQMRARRLLMTRQIRNEKLLTAA